MLKTSRFNFWAPVGENQHLLFNGISGALYELTSQERILALRFFDAPGNQSVNSDDLDLYRLLVEGGFVIPDYVDEVEKLLARNRLECVNHQVLDLVIVPTYECNFRCKYCYVDFRKGRMSCNVEESIVYYIKRVLSRYHQMNISWFGGEPLLCLPTVLRVSRQIREIAHQCGVQLNNFISTNGYMLDSETAHRLSEAGIRFFHITIDGPPRYHDQLRVLANGNSTYLRIIEHLKNLLAHVPDAHITLRMNTNESTIDSLWKVLDEVPAGFRWRIQVNVTPIRYEDKMPSLDLYHKINEVTRYALEKGYLYYDIQIPVKRKTFCMADKRSNFQIGPDGTLHKCSPSPNKPEARVGCLNSLGLAELSENYEVWHGAPVVGDYCFDCPYLCFCAGGCRLERLRQTQDLSCRDKFRDIENMIINRYLAILNRAFEVSL